MECIVEFNELLRFEFNGEGYRQKILMDILLNYSEHTIVNLSTTLQIPLNQLMGIQNGKYLQGEQANDLAQLFLLFWGRIFFKSGSLVRNFS